MSGATKQKQKKNIKVEKNPNKPRGPPRPYFIWYKENFPKLKVSNPDLTGTQLQKMAGSIWMDLDPESKAEYHDRYKLAREDYQMELAAYKEMLDSEKDLKKPRIPPKPFIMFYTENLTMIKASNPVLNGNELAKKAASIWKDLDPESKADYNDRHKLAREEYLIEQAYYERLNPEKDFKRPRKPPGSYLMWWKDNFPKLKASNPDLKGHELQEKAASIWMDLDPESKAEYYDRYELAREEYLIEQAAYERSRKGSDTVNSCALLDSHDSPPNAKGQ